MILQDNQIAIDVNGTITYIKPWNGSTHYNELMGDEYLSIKFAQTDVISLPIGSKITYNNQDFVLLQTPNIKKVNETNYEYDCKFHGLKDQLNYFMFVEQANDKTNCRTTFTMTAKPLEFIRLIAVAINDRLGVEIPNDADNNHIKLSAEDIEKTIHFENVSIRDALNEIANEYECEWNIYFNENGCFLDFGNIIYDNEELVLDYGKDKGLKSGVSITPENQPQIKRLWVQGTERNIDFYRYLPANLATYIGLTKSSRLILPYNSLGAPTDLPTSTTIKYDTKKKLFGRFDYSRLSYTGKNNAGVETYTMRKFTYQADRGFNENSQDVREYSLDRQGRYIERVGVNAVYESSYVNEDVYPSKVCDVNTCTITEGSGEDLGTFTIKVKVNKWYKPTSTSTLCYSYENNVKTYLGSIWLDTTKSYELDTTDYFQGTYNNQNAIYVKCYFDTTQYITINQYVNGYYDSCYVLYGVINTSTGLVSRWNEDTTKTFPNYRNLVADGEKAVVVFQSGMLAGKEFEMQTITEGGNVYPNFTLTEHEATFVCLRQEIDNIVMPETITGYNAKQGDYFAVYGVLMPTEYLADAEVNLLKASVKYMAENEDQKYQFSGDLDALWVQNHASDKSKLLVLGQAVRNSDFSQYGMKITQISTDLCDEYKKSITFSSGRKHETLGSRLKRLV